MVHTYTCIHVSRCIKLKFNCYNISPGMMETKARSGPTSTIHGIWLRVRVTLRYSSSSHKVSFSVSTDREAFIIPA